MDKNKAVNILHMIKKSGTSGDTGSADAPVPGEAKTKQQAKPLSAAMERMLSEQYTAEAHSAEIYFGMAAFFADSHLDGFSKYFRAQACEEREHACKFFDYLILCNTLIKMGPMEGVKTGYKDLTEVARAFLDHEKMVSERIFAIAEAARKENDLYTASWIEEFLIEQLDEVRAAEDLYKHAQLIGSDGTGLLMLDQQYGSKS